MRLAHSSSLGGWALVEGVLLKHVAGALSAWSPRIASGEGRTALPLTGRKAPIASAEPLSPANFRRILTGPADGAWPLGLAAVVGCSLVGRTNPFRSIVGYVGLAQVDGRMVFGRYLVTREEFGDAPPRLGAHPMIHVTAREHLDTFGEDLGTGDLLILGPVKLPSPLAAAVWGDRRAST